jgi:drug/metabolite transporter (DMT)-like permease
MEWLSLSLICAFSMATADAATKRWLSDYSAQELVVVRFVSSGLLLAPLLFIQSWPKLPAVFWGWVGAMIPLEIIAMWLYMKAIQESPLALTLPYLAFTPVFVVLTGFLLLDERISVQGWCGIILVVIGAYALNLKQAAGQTSWLAPLRAIAYEPGSRLMLMVAAIYSLTSVMGKGALQYTSPVFFAPFYFCTLGVITLFLLIWSGTTTINILWRRPAQHLAVGTAMAVMILSHLAAIQFVEVAYMIAVKRTSLLFGILYGAILFQEPDPIRNLTAGSLMVSGVVLIAL